MFFLFKYMILIIKVVVLLLKSWIGSKLKCDIILDLCVLNGSDEKSPQMMRFWQGLLKVYETRLVKWTLSLAVPIQLPITNKIQINNII